MKTHLFVIGLLLTGIFAGCEKPEEQPAAEPQVATVGDGWLTFSLRPAEGPTPDNMKRYQAAYVADGKTRPLRY